MMRNLICQTSWLQDSVPIYLLLQRLRALFFAYQSTGATMNQFSFCAFRESRLKRKYVICMGILCTLLCTACTSQQLYSTGQAYQRQQCLKIPDTEQSRQCMSNADKSYDDYQHETGAVSK